MGFVVFISLIGERCIWWQCEQTPEFSGPTTLQATWVELALYPENSRILLLR